MAEAEMHIYGGDLPCHCRTLRHHLKLVLGDDTINRLDPYLDPLLSEVERLRGKLRIAEARIAGAKALLTALSDQ